MHKIKKNNKKNPENKIDENKRSVMKREDYPLFKFNSQVLFLCFAQLGIKSCLCTDDDGVYKDVGW